MKDKVIKDPAASTRARLFAHAKIDGEDFQRVLTRYAIERLLFRLSQTDAAESYVLKGAMLFVTWPRHAAFGLPAISTCSATATPPPAP
ncbi:hypothetical protein [Mesorhizobium silamurunense]|uniref:hypothetical protein n=1 Tax=Mesorhizobium silamurunense TaxID=499528 RepID=UPI00177E88EC|nr:hypothetical protein [Mesorhizobium silamurunense]